MCFAHTFSMKKEIFLEFMKNVDERESAVPNFIKKDFKNEKK